MDADPKVLYVLAAAVCASLLVWVAVVLIRAPKR